MALRADQMASCISFAKFSQATDLKKRLWFTLAALIVFRFLLFLPLPCIDPTVLSPLYAQTKCGILDFFNTFSCGSLDLLILISLVVIPFFSSSFFFLLSFSLSPSF